ncbi:diguanylate cyclase (GGDEF)-like protein [Anoxybacillus kamchatkensis]|uniref:GGDEF domain-containing protein n=1 Tax=Anoxybacillus ayderensis TaxID=265546 RepID=UPI0015EC9DB0|nr:GGDEF domain-containing protein [Anoxybacillus ayderensis]MBA2878619.1 diguanylate cyclase (GGDEF)-like protein [Anoxybacillus ayderensis]
MIFNDHLLKVASKTNIDRLYKLSWAITIITIIYFFLSFIGRLENKLVYSYNSLLFIIIANICFGMLFLYISRQKAEGTKKAYVIQAAYFMLHLFLGVLLSIHDQYMNVLWISCIGMGVLFLIPPLVGGIMYVLTFVLSSIVLSSHDAPTLLEWITHVPIHIVIPEGLGFGVSLIVWRNYTKNYKQQLLTNIEQQQLAEKNASLQALAIQDRLTGLFNRTHFVDLVNAYLKESDHEEATILIIDIDFFKHVNDHFGHPAGDQVLKALSVIIKQYFQHPNLSARLGGEEFIVFLPETSTEKARDLSETLRENIEKCPFQYKEHTIHITASFGIAQAIHSFQHCYPKADQALYLAKQLGRNRVVVSVI